MLSQREDCKEAHTIRVLSEQDRKKIEELAEAIAQFERALEAIDLEAIRNDLNVSQDGLGRLLGIPGQTVLRWERAYSVPKLDSLRKFCVKLLRQSPA